MVLICSEEGDLSAKRVSAILGQRNICYSELHINDYPVLSPEFVLKNNSISNRIGLDLSKISSIYFRLVVFPCLPSSKMPEMYRNFLTREMAALFLGQLMPLNVKWIINPFYAHLASYKVVQIEHARKIGFNIPDTCISTDSKVLFDFYQERKDKGIKVITKAIHMGYIQSENFNPDEDEFIFTQEAEIKSMNEIPQCHPLLLQERILSDYEIRCFVVGDKIFSAKIQAVDGCIDYRNANSRIKVESFILPQVESQQCKLLTRSFNLNYSAIDLLFSNGKYFFLDFNSTGEWLWYEDNAQLPISDAIIGLFE